MKLTPKKYNIPKKANKKTVFKVVSQREDRYYSHTAFGMYIDRPHVLEYQLGKSTTADPRFLGIMTFEKLAQAREFFIVFGDRYSKIMEVATYGKGVRPKIMWSLWSLRSVLRGAKENLELSEEPVPEGTITYRRIKPIRLLKKEEYK